MADNTGVTYGKIITEDHDKTLSLGCLSQLFLVIGVGGVGGYAVTHDMSYKEAILLWGIVLISVSVPLGIGLVRWWRDPRNAKPGLGRWRFEAGKEEVFLMWCRTQKWYGSDDVSDLNLRDQYRAHIEGKVRNLDEVELYKWCEENLTKKGFWEGAGEILAGLAEMALFTFLDGDE